MQRMQGWIRHVTGSCIVVAVVGLLAAGPSTEAARGNPTPGVIPPNRQYSELSAAWWQWAFAQPVATNPLFDLTGEEALNGQPTKGNVIFLAGLIAVNQGLNASAERSITIPTGKRLFFPILNSETDNVGVDPPFTIAELRALAANVASSLVSLHASLDGVPIQDLTSYRTISPVFGYTLPETDNLYQFFGFDVSGPQFPAVGDGYYLLLNPLPPGEHTLNFGGVTTIVVDAEGNTAPFSLDITYHINVVPGGK